MLSKASKALVVHYSILPAAALVPMPALGPLLLLPEWLASAQQDAWEAVQHHRSVARFAPCARLGARHSGSLRAPDEIEKHATLDNKVSLNNQFREFKVANCFCTSTLHPCLRKLCSASDCACSRKPKTPSQELNSDAATCWRACLSVKGSALESNRSSAGSTSSSRLTVA